MTTQSLTTADAVPSLVQKGYRLYKTVPTNIVVAEQEQEAIRRHGHEAVLLATEPPTVHEPMYLIYWKPKPNGSRPPRLPATPAAATT